ncbi:MAG TPA: carbohydrate-binding family 9-like protein [Clostridia bacterium]|nr:carbohydrate-binding family 9-like protein [Clostridia bacterium]
MGRVCEWKKVRDDEVNPLIWEQIDPVLIEEYPWDENGYKPRVEVRFFYTESRLHLQFTSYESEIRAVYRNMNEPVYTDSCVEFFFNPDPHRDDRYFNFEINAIGTLLLELGNDRNNRLMIRDTPQDIFCIKSSVSPDNADEYEGDSWILELSIPYSFIERYYGSQDFSPGKRMRGNFQKCGDKTKFPHHGSWNRIDTLEADFHRPEYFGDLILK